MTSRNAFVTREYRTITEERLAVRSSHPDTARIVNLDTNLDLVGARIRALEEADSPSGGMYEITIEALLFQDGMIAAPARYKVYSKPDNLDGEEFRAFAANLDLVNGTTVVKVRA